ncbi:hypothetical protein PV10_05531 [Exophiala mesophila]|uniref:UFSP1/2/DUB catalytic domain-containing protein n=1 Tax=Exophiala mesophila TaxID=212818 RepID=A0A0D1WPE8_EXOME|nr:uncharacterized protein PV10_05531 [Exophiala mesophila]KIV90930.1 hypothetical protein PV10_05531 [Exophiala mesophila]
MAFRPQDAEDESLRCPFCSFVTDEFDDLQNHVDRSHAESDVGGSAQSWNSSTAHLNDFELAQLLAFEEAGLPSELALSENSNAPARPGQGPEEATMNPRDDLPNPKVGDHETPSWVPCICGERVDMLELDAHADMHAQEDVSATDVDLVLEERHPAQLSNGFTTTISQALRNQEQLQSRTPPKNGRTRISPLKEMFLGTSSSPKRSTPYKAVVSKQGRSKRLGRAELGPFAHEKQMPDWLERMLEDGAKTSIINRIGPDGLLNRVEVVANETPHLIPVLARLSQLDRSVERAFYCSPDVRHIAKIPREGGFCGYRNIQMLVSYIQESASTGYRHFPGRTPSILRIQDMIESAWDRGFNSTGRLETGGIKLTRKYIGTPEAQALLMSLDIPCEATAYASTDTVEASETMLCAVCEYFDDQDSRDNRDKVVITSKPPIYFQHHGHSMTIVGVESRVDGLVNLVVYDPMFNPSAVLKKLALTMSRAFKCAEPEKLLKAHRRGESYLSRYRDFELLKLMDGKTPAAPAG